MFFFFGRFEEFKIRGSETRVWFFGSVCLGIGDVGAEFGGRFAIISGFWGFGIGGCPWEIRDFDSVKV